MTAPFTWGAVLIATLVTVDLAVGDEVLVVQLRDEPGALARVAENLKQAGVNIQSMHILNRSGGHAMIALTTDDRCKRRR